MTLNETRDALAEMDGWQIFTMPHGDKLYLAPSKPDDADCQVDCPHPPTLDGADAAVTAAGCVWGRGREAKFNCESYYWFWWAEHIESLKAVSVPDTGDKIADLYALALACRRAMEKTNA